MFSDPLKLKFMTPEIAVRVISLISDDSVIALVEEMVDALQMT
jgi:hypothetical protein